MNHQVVKLLQNMVPDDWIAQSVAAAVRKAEANGHLICGHYYLESFCTQLRNGRVNGSLEPKVSKPRTACIAVDAGLTSIRTRPASSN